MRSSNALQRETLFETGADPAGIVNVASVPQRSPFRYPGGKTWLVPRVRAWLASLPWKPDVLVEPFAGGGVVGLTAAFERLADRVVMVELDGEVAAAWKTILSDDNEWLARRVEDFHVTQESVRETLSKETSSARERGFRTILKNRTFHGGILAPGSGLIKTGENGRGVGSRWYPATLARRIRDIEKIRDRVQFIEGDGPAVMGQYAHVRRAAFFVDPPYTAAGKRAGTRLYSHHELDHEALFAQAARLAGQFMMTYDYNEEIKALAARHGFAVSAVAMKNTHHARMKELLVEKTGPTP